VPSVAYVNSAEKLQARRCPPGLERATSGREGKKKKLEFLGPTSNGLESWNGEVDYSCSELVVRKQRTQ